MNSLDGPHGSNSHFDETNMTSADIVPGSAEKFSRSKVVPKLVQETFIDPAVLKGTW